MDQWTWQATSHPVLRRTVEEGLKYRDLIQKAADEQCFEAATLTPPLEWDVDNAVRGGYLNFHPGQVSRLIHNDKGTVPSSEAIAALHKTQGPLPDQPIHL